MRPYVEADEISLVYSGSNYFEVLDRIIDESCYTLHFQTYIFETDSTGMHVLESLKRAAARGVRVHLMVDAYASFPFPKDVRNDLIASGIQFRLFSPLLSSESIFIGRRLHHKVVVADGKTGLVGGINIADKYNTTVNVLAWLDYAVLIKGDVCGYLHALCEQFYYRSKARLLRKWERKVAGLINTGTHRFVRFRRNDWIMSQNEIHKSYLEAIIKAESSITLVASYFLPGQNIRRLLKEASERGVKISVIMAGRSDIASMRMAEHYLYSFYLRNNIHVFEWTDSVMHGKAMIVDNTWATIGSYNLNFLSHYVSIELNADIIDKPFIEAFGKHLDEVMSKSCVAVELQKEKHRTNLFSKFLMWLAYNFYRILMTLALRGKKYKERTRKRKRRLGRRKLSEE